LTGTGTIRLDEHTPYQALGFEVGAQVVISDGHRAERLRIVSIDGRNAVAESLGFVDFMPGERLSKGYRKHVRRMKATERRA
jgi:hypothetical protein